MGLKDVQPGQRRRKFAMFPQLRADDIVGGSFCSTDGFVDPYSAMNGFMAWAADHGAKLWKNTEVTGIRRDEKARSALKPPEEMLSTRKVVNCAGAWAAEDRSDGGLDLPVEPLRRMLVPTEPFDQFPHQRSDDHRYVERLSFPAEGLGFLLAWNDPEETPGYKTEFEPAFIEKILTRAADRVPISKILR